MTDKSRYVRFDWAIKRILHDKAKLPSIAGGCRLLVGQVDGLHVLLVVVVVAHAAQNELGLDAVAALGHTVVEAAD